MMTPADVCKSLNISGSTLRKYAIEFEKEGIIFQRNNKNARLFTVMESEAIHNAMIAAQSGRKSFENAVSEEVERLKGYDIITTEKTAMQSSSSRHDDSATAAMLNEIRSLKEEIRERDSLFVEALERMQQKLDRMEERQRQVDGPNTEQPKENGLESQSQQPIPKKKGFFSRLFK